MTGNFIIDNAISAAGIAFVVLIVFLLFRPRPARLDEGRARARIAIDEPDFSIASMLLSADGRVALGRSDEEAFVVVACVGDSLITRRFRAGDAVVVSEGDALIVKLPDMTVRPFEFGAIDGAASWARALRGEDAKVA